MDKQFKNMQKLAFGKVNKNINESELKDKIKELVTKSLGEAKKKKDDDVMDAAPQNSDVEMETSVDTITPDHSKETDINPVVKSIQDSLQKAFAGAKSLGDAKLVTQIGNTITMLVRDQVLGGGQQAVAENKGK